MKLEKMDDFFNARVDIYDEHMLTEVDGAQEYYAETAKLLGGAKIKTLLDLGCGTGLELEAIFQVHPSVEVTGIDLSADMLARLREKFAGKLQQIHLIQGDYFSCEYTGAPFDAALSVQTMHHFSHEAKIKLYHKIYESLKPGGFYIETDYTAPTKEYEEFYFAENERLRAENGITEGYYHYDTPCTAQTLIGLLQKAGFQSVERLWRTGNTEILKAYR